MKTDRKPLRVLTRPPASDKYDSILREYIMSSPAARLDFLQSTRAVDGVFFLNSTVHTLSHVRIDRVKDGEKELTSVTDSSHIFYVFRIDAAKAVRDFSAHATFAPNNEKLPEGVDCGRPLRKTLAKQK